MTPYLASPTRTLDQALADRGISIVWVDAPDGQGWCACRDDGDQIVWTGELRKTKREAENDAL